MPVYAGGRAVGQVHEHGRMRELAGPNRPRRICLGGTPGCAEWPRIFRKPVAGHAALDAGLAGDVTVLQVVEPAVAEENVLEGRG